MIFQSILESYIRRDIDEWLSLWGINTVKVNSTSACVYCEKTFKSLQEYSTYFDNHYQLTVISKFTWPQLSWSCEDMLNLKIVELELF